MLYTIPDYYREFHCIADKCEDTCCAGWQIVIDEKSLKNYKNIRGSFMWRLKYSVDWKNKVFRQDKEKRCAFLNEQNLCDLYTICGEKSLCRTCRQYPRHIEEFENVRELTLSISCPEAARILMERKSPVKFLTYEKEGEEEYEEFDPFFFSILEDARKSMIQILQNRSLPIRNRVLLVLGMAHDMQRRVNHQEMFDCFSVIEKYESEKAIAYVRNYAEKLKQEIKQKRNQKNLQKKERYQNEKDLTTITRVLFDKLYELELLKEDWDMLLQETEVTLYAEEMNRKNTKVFAEEKYPDFYQGKVNAFEEWMKEEFELEIHLEQLLVYFLFTYFLGAVYDGEVYAKVQMAVYCTWMIRELWIAKWLKNGKKIELEEMIDLVYRFSREVEHSDENLKRIEKIMEKKWI